MRNFGLRLLSLACVGHGLRVATRDDLVFDTVLGSRPRREVGARGILNQFTRMLMAFNPPLPLRFASRGSHSPNRIAWVPRVFNIRASTNTEDVFMREFVCAKCGYTVFPALGREQEFLNGFSCPSCNSPQDEFVDMSDGSDPRRGKVNAMIAAQEVAPPPGPVEEIVAPQQVPPASTVAASEEALETAPAPAAPPEETDDDEYEELESNPFLHEFRCADCGYTLFPAEGREGKFFPDSFKCPQKKCAAPKESFFDMTDLTDPRTVKALREEGYVIEEVLDEEEEEDAKAEEDSTPSAEAVAPTPVVEDGTPSAPSAEDVAPTPAAAEVSAPTPAVAEAADDDRNEFQKFLDAQRETQDSAAPAEAWPSTPAVAEAPAPAPVAAQEAQPATSQVGAVQQPVGATSASPVGNQAELRQRRPAVDDWTAFKNYPPPPVHQLSRRGEEPPPEVAKPPEDDFLGLALKDAIDKSAQEDKPVEQEPREEEQPTQEAAPSAKLGDIPSEDKPAEEEPREEAQPTQEAAPSGKGDELFVSGEPFEFGEPEETSQILEDVVPSSLPDEMFWQELEGTGFDPLANDLIGFEPLTKDELKMAQTKLDEFVLNSANRAEAERKAAEEEQKFLEGQKKKEEERAAKAKKLKEEAEELKKKQEADAEVKKGNETKSED